MDYVHAAIRDHLTVTQAQGLAAFFFQQVGALVRQFPNLFGLDGEEDQGQEGEGEDEGADPAGAGSFSERWGWIDNVRVVADTTRSPWDAVWRMTAMEFFGILSYARDREERDRKAIEDWKRRH